PPGGTGGGGTHERTGGVRAPGREGGTAAGAWQGSAPDAGVRAVLSPAQTPSETHGPRGGLHHRRNRYGASRPVSYPGGHRRRPAPAEGPGDGGLDSAPPSGGSCRADRRLLPGGADGGWITRDVLVLREPDDGLCRPECHLRVTRGGFQSPAASVHRISQP